MGKKNNAPEAPAEEQVETAEAPETPENEVNEVEETPAEEVAPEVEPESEKPKAKAKKQKDVEPAEPTYPQGAEPANKLVEEAMQDGLKPDESWKVINGKLHIEVALPNGTTRLRDEAWDKPKQA